MITSMGIILMSGLILGKITGKLKLPPLLGMIAAGMIIGPYLLPDTQTAKKRHAKCKKSEEFCILRVPKSPF